MLRTLRIIGIVVFALFAGLSANTLFGMYESGDLSQRYNSARKANITLLGFSIISLCVLGYYELTRVRRHAVRYAYGQAKREEEEAEPVDPDQTSCIYSAPETQGAWKTDRARGSKSRSRKKKKDKAETWMSVVRVSCLVLPFFYLGLSLMCRARMDPEKSLSCLFPIIFIVMLFFSLISMFGLIRIKPWGMTAGYMMAVFNLLVFPFGTIMGLFLLIGLVGAAPLFEVPAKERRKKARMKARLRNARKRQKQESVA